ncbi:unnamed protein product [Absidia cylindrospora]
MHDTSLHLHNLKHALLTISQQDSCPKDARQMATEILDNWKVNVGTIGAIINNNIKKKTRALPPSPQPQAQQQKQLQLQQQAQQAQQQQQSSAAALKPSLPPPQQQQESSKKKKNNKPGRRR